MWRCTDMKWNLHGKRNKCSRVQSSIVNDFRIELDNIDASRTLNSDAAQVHNLVGTCRIISTLPSFNLLAVSNLLPNSIYEKQKFAAITIRLGEPTCTVLLFTSGKMVLTGCKSLFDCMLASKIVTNLLIDGFPGIVFKLEDVKIQNIVGNALLSMAENEVLDLDAFYKDYNIFCTYQPTMFPGLIYRPVHLPVVFLIFFSGKIVITGAKTLMDVYGSWSSFREILRNFKKTNVHFKANHSDASMEHRGRMNVSVPVALKHQVKLINILESDFTTVNKKLEERTVCNIVTYLQLMLLKLDRQGLRSKKLIQKVKLSESIKEYSSFVSESESMGQQ